MAEDEHERHHLLEHRDTEDAEDIVLASISSADTTPSGTSIPTYTNHKNASNGGRHLSWQSVYILIISRVIGTGLFAAPGVVTRSTGSIGLCMVFWILGAGVAACGLAISVEYGCMLPRSGGEKIYLEYTYQHPRYLATTLVTVRAVLLNFTASNCIVFGQYVLFALNIESTDGSQKLLAVGLLAFATLVHSCLPRLGVIIQNVLGWVKIGLIVFMVFSGFVVIALRKSEGPSPYRWGELWHGSKWELGSFATGIFTIIYAFDGMDNANFVLSEVKDPRKTLQSVSAATFCSVVLLYILSNIAYFIVVPIEDIKENGELVAALYFQRCFGLNIGRMLLPFAVALSAAGSVMVTTYSKGRLNQEIARQGFLPSYLASSRPFDAPLGGLIVHFIPSFLAITLPPSKDSYSFVLDLGTYPKQFTTVFLCIGLLWLRYREPELERPFKAWTVAVVLMTIMALSLIVAPLIPPRENTTGLFYATYAIVGTGILLCGVSYWYLRFVLFPNRNGYKIIETSDTLEDGTTIIRLRKVSTK